MIEDRSVVHIVFKHGQPIIFASINLSKQVKLLEMALQDEFAIGSNVPVGHVFVLLV